MAAATSAQIAIAATTPASIGPSSLITHLARDILDAEGPEEGRVDRPVTRARTLPGASPARSVGLETALIAVLVGFAYYVAAHFSLRLALVRGQVTPIWPPSGIAVAAMLVFGRRIWPGIALAAFAVNAPLGPSILGAATIATGNTVAPVLAVTLLNQVGFRPDLRRLQDAMAIVGLGALSAMLVSANRIPNTILATAISSIVIPAERSESRDPTLRAGIRSELSPGSPFGRPG